MMHLRENPKMHMLIIYFSLLSNADTYTVEFRNIERLF